MNSFLLRPCKWFTMQACDPKDLQPSRKWDQNIFHGHAECLCSLVVKATYINNAYLIYCSSIFLVVFCFAVINWFGFFCFVLVF